MEWHIDAWDASAGRAFATQRTRNSDIGRPDEEVWGPTVFIGPPSFRPEQIANIGIALNARRSGAFDPRVPLNPEIDEIEFNTADAVADFVRRAFTGSIRNRGGDGGGAIGFEGGPAGPPPGGDGEPSGAERFLGEWLDGAQRLEKDPRPLAYYYGTQLPFTFAPSQSIPASGHLDSVQRGALQVLATVLDAIPLFGLHMPMFAQWQHAAITLDSAVSELGLWGTWFTAVEPVQLDISRYLRTRNTQLVPQDQQESIDGISFAQLALRWQPTSADPKEAAGRFWNNLNHAQVWSGDYLARVQPQMADRYEALLIWPVPRYVQTEPVCRSVGELLATFVSSPSAFAKRAPGTIDIVAFAAALLASRMEDRTREGWRERAAAAWLARSVPRWQFRKDVEELILDPANQRVLQMAGA